MRAIHGAAVLLLAILLLAACGPEPTPEQRLEAIRYAHDIVPLGYTTVTGPEGRPQLLVDMEVVNHATEPLDRLTVLVTVRGPDDAVKAKKRVTLDLSDLRPGVGVQVGTTVPGVVAEEGDEVTVEIEPNLSEEVLRSLPEYADVAPEGAVS